MGRLPRRCRSRRWLPWVVALSALILALAPGPLRAESGQPADAKAVARAKALEGSRIADEGQHERALAFFREAYALYPEPAYLYDIGVECQALGRDVEALDAYGHFLRDPGNTPRALITQASELQAEIEKRLGEIRLRGAPEGAEIDIDNQPRGPAPPGEPLRAKPGSHRVVVRRPGFEPFRAEVQVPEGGAVTVDVLPMSALTPVPPASEERKPWVSWAFSLGVGFWTGGPPKDTGPSPNLALGAGHVVATLPGHVDLELGAKLGLTYISEPAGTDTFISVLANPRLVKPLNDRFRAFVEVGAGLLVLSGVPDDSVLLQPEGGRVTGALATFELRPSIGLAYALADTLRLDIAPSFIWNPSPSELFAHASLTRIEVAIGLMGEL